MENFAKQSLRLGAMKGFRHVNFYLRGKEELLVVVKSPSSGADDDTGSDDAGGAEQAFRQGLPPNSPASREEQPVRPRAAAARAVRQALIPWPH